MRTVRCSVFTLRRVHDIRQFLYAKSKNNRLKDKEICKVTWRLKKSALIRSIPAIRAKFVVLAIHVILAILVVPTRLSKMKMMLAIHIFSIIPTSPFQV